jgi:hypothetical protein
MIISFCGRMVRECDEFESIRKELFTVVLKYNVVIYLEGLR